MSARAVTMIGLGPMGRAMVDALLENGNRVTVWNRTASRVDKAVGKGARGTVLIEEALAASELVLLSLTDYAAMYEILDPVASSLTGRVLVNLGASSPEEARAAARWASKHGARYLAGSPMVPPTGIGSSESSTLYSGPREILDDYRDVLDVLTSCDYRGEDTGLAAVYYQIGMDIFLSLMIGYLHAMAIARANGISASDYVPYAALATSVVAPSLFPLYASRIDTNQHPGDMERLGSIEPEMEQLVRTASEAGVDTSLPEALRAILSKAVADGDPNAGLSSLVEFFAKPEA